MKQKITAYTSILENSLVGTVFIASPLDELTQCQGENREHVKWVGELDVPIDNPASILRELFQEIKHGDQEHQDWLESKIEDFINFRGY